MVNFRKINYLFTEWKKTNHSEKVIEEILKEYKPMLLNMAIDFVKGNALYYTVDDIIQELRIIIWKNLLHLEKKNKDEEPDITNFIQTSLRNRIRRLHQKVVLIKKRESKVILLNDDICETQSNGGKEIIQGDLQIDMRVLQNKFPKDTMEYRIIEVMLEKDPKTKEDVARRLNSNSTVITHKLEKIKQMWEKITE